MTSCDICCRKGKEIFVINIILNNYLSFDTKMVNHLYVFYTVVMVTSSVAWFTWVQTSVHFLLLYLFILVALLCKSLSKLELTTRGWLSVQHQPTSWQGGRRQTNHRIGTYRYRDHFHHRYIAKNGKMSSHMIISLIKVSRALISVLAGN